MTEIHFSEGYYGSNTIYSNQDPQLKLIGVKYNRGSLIFNFKGDDNVLYEKNSRDPLEMLVLSEILYGSQLWSYKASATIVNMYGNNTRNSVNILVNVEDTYINEYKDLSVGFKVYLSTFYNNLKRYGGYDSYPKIRDISFLPYIEAINQPPNFKVELFDYQKKSVAKMLGIEKGTINLSCNYNYRINFGETEINYNPFSGSPQGHENSKLIIKSNGGILADEMGLGKTITSLAIVALNPSNYNDMYKNNLIFSKATLIVCPSHLSKQWESEVKRIFPKANVIKLLTKNNHVKLTYKEMKEADIIIVTHQFLMNFKYYPQVNYYNCTPSSFVFDSRITHLKNILKEWIDSSANIMEKVSPNLEHFYFHRLIVDEGHEIFGLQFGNASMAKYMSEWLSTVNSDYKWFVSGTPFVNFDGLNKSFQFINLKLTDEKSGTIMNNVEFINKEYIITQILSNIMIRHRKEDVNNQIKIPGYEEEVIWVKLTDLEKNLYNSKKQNYVSDLTLQQLCCHILISDTTNKYFGSNTEVDLSQMQDKLIEFHKNNVVNYQHKLENLNPTNQAYAMLKKNFQNKISESNYMLKILDKMAKKEDLDLEQNCSICFDELSNPSLTSCGHIFCKECLEMCLQVKKLCPMCKTDLTGKEIYLIDSKKDEEKNPEEENPLIKKYGSKLGKLVSLVRTLITDDNNRIIIFSQWDRMLNLIGKTLSENGVANSFVKGNVWSRNSAISKFKLGKDSTGEDNKVIMLSLSNSASGTNLTEATHIIFVEPINSKHEEVKAIESQAIGRACRLGQKNKVKVIRILTQNTIEQEIYDSIYSKNQDNIKRTIMIDDGDLNHNLIV